MLGDEEPKNYWPLAWSYIVTITLATVLTIHFFPVH